MGRRSMTRLRPQAGMTLVEVMVAVAIGLFLVAAMGSIYLGSKGTYGAQDAVARLQENGRFAIDTLAGDLRMAGPRGCRASGGSTPMPVNTLNNAGVFPYDFDRGVFASRSEVTGWSPALPTALASLSQAVPNAQGDVLVVYRPAGTAWGVTAAMSPDGSAPLQVGSTTDIQLGDVLMVSDCRSGAVFQATSLATAPGGAIAIGHQPAAGFAPGVSTADLQRTFDNDAVVRKVTTNAYYLAPSLRPERQGQMSLFLCDLGCLRGTDPTAPVELVSGVEKFQVTLGIDSGTTPGSADQYVTPSAVTDWTQVVSVRITMLLASSQDNLATAPQPYTWDDASVTPTDRRLRVVMSTSANVRNH